MQALNLDNTIAVTQNFCSLANLHQASCLIKMQLENRLLLRCGQKPSKVGHNTHVIGCGGFSSSGPKLCRKFLPSVEPTIGIALRATPRRTLRPRRQVAIQAQTATTRAPKWAARLRCQRIGSGLFTLVRIFSSPATLSDASHNELKQLLTQIASKTNEKTRVRANSDDLLEPPRLMTKLPFLSVRIFYKLFYNKKARVYINSYSLSFVCATLEKQLV